MSNLNKLLIVCLFAICSASMKGQDNVLVFSKEVSNRAEKENEILRRCKTYTSVHFVDFNLSKLLEYEDFSLQIGARNIPVKKERLDIRGINSYVFVGGNNDRCRILISVLNDNIQGVIETDENVYTIETVGKKEYALITVDYSQLREACDNLEDDHSCPSFSYANNQNSNSSIDSNVEVNSSNISNKSATYDCKIRVLVLYTPTAPTSYSVSNIKNTILTAVELTNQSFINSQINYRIELVYAGQTDYTESGFSTDLTRFRVPGDGYMDEVHILRNKYSADICVLLVRDPEYCGLAYVGVTENNAFCVVSTNSTCATTNYSFGHEIGHLLGCRHDPAVDSGTTPFAYGHGYVNPSKTWRTIMAYNPDSDYCPRLQYWSNPNVIYGGEPMGTVATSNNTRVWNERSNTVLTFRQPNNDVTFTSSDMPNTMYADVIAKQNITTSGIVNTNSGNTLNMRAGNSITLQPGFSVEKGAEFSAVIDDIDDCGDCDMIANKIIAQTVTDKFSDYKDTQINKGPAFSYTVLPNASKDVIYINYSVDEEMPLSIEMVDMFGQKIMTILPNQNIKIGNSSIHVPVSGLSKGTYFLVISSNNQINTEKIIINK